MRSVEKKRIVLPLLVTACLMSTNIHAETGDIKFNGLLRFAYEISDSEAPYLEQVDEDGTFGRSHMALNFLSKINHHWHAAGQLFARTSGELELDWAFATYYHTDSMQVRLGKQKYPLGLLTEAVDVGVAYPWTTPPAEIYQLEVGDESPNFVQENFVGVSLVYSGGDDFEWTLQPFFGEFSGEEGGGSYKNIFGLKYEIGNETFTVQAGATTTRFFYERQAPEPSIEDKSKTTINFGVKYETDSFLAYAEYADTTVDDFEDFDATASYVTLGYKMNKMTPAVTFATLEGQEGALDQTSYTLSLAYAYAVNTVIKAQLMHIEPDDPTTEGLIDELPDGEDSANVLSVTLDLVF